MAPSHTIFVRDYYGKQVNVQLDEAGVEAFIAELLGPEKALDYEMWKKASAMADKVVG